MRQVRARTEINMKFLWEEPEGNRQLGRHRHRWENNIKLDLKDMGWEYV
jgi:hypothetical protein